MCCIGDCLIKYALTTVNIIFSLLGLAIVGLGIGAHVQLSEITELFPVNLRLVSVGIIVLGVVVFVLAFLACCGAILRSMWMLITYGICMLILAGIKIYVAVVSFNFLKNSEETVTGWINDAFQTTSLAPAFIAMESVFQCCGTTGANSYPGILPATCCANPIDGQCQPNDAFGGCTELVSSWFARYGGAISGVMIGVIIFEVVCMVFAFHVTNNIRNDRSKGRY